MKTFIKKTFQFFNNEINKTPNKNLQKDEKIDKRNDLLNEYRGFHLYSDLTDEEIDIIYQVKPFTLTNPERIVALISAVKYIINNNIPGDFVECGVWKGGSMMVVALTLIKMGVNDRNLYLYDTYEGMSAPSHEDISYDNQTAAEQLSMVEKGESDNIWCYSTLEEVKNNFNTIKYDQSKIHFIKGKVEDTIPGIVPKKIALLRLDTDWYESTYHELINLFPLIEKYGILIIDDYGHWKGAKTATDKFIQETKQTFLLNRIDYASRIAQII